MKRYWQFVAILDDGADMDEGYLTADGDLAKDRSEVPFFIADDEEAEAEAYRRCALYENKNGCEIVDVVAESNGKVS